MCSSSMRLTPSSPVPTIRRTSAGACSIRSSPCSPSPIPTCSLSLRATSARWKPCSPATPASRADSPSAISSRIIQPISSCRSPADCWSAMSTSSPPRPMPRCSAPSTSRSARRCPTSAMPAGSSSSCAMASSPPWPIASLPSAPSICSISRQRMWRKPSVSSILKPLG